MLTTPQQRAVEHICYEVGSLLRHFDRWSRKQLATPCDVNDTIELILIHSRNLIDFFEMTRTATASRHRRAQTDGVIADDYRFPYDPFQITDGVKRRIEKEVAHLTYSRCGLSQAEKSWDFPSIVPEILRRCYSFLRYVHETFGRSLPINDAGRVSVLLDDLKRRWAF
jgi:hypothetical protein